LGKQGGIVKLLFTGLLLVLSLRGLASAAERPNILFCIADDASFEHFGINGCSWVNTPNIDKVAEQGINFTAVYTPNPKCAPSRSVIITGRNPWQLEAAANHWPIFPLKFKSYPEALGEAGYEVAFTGKGWGPGSTQGRNLTGKKYSKIRIKNPPASGISNVEYTRNFEKFLTERDASKPFAFWFGCHEPHRKYEYKSGARLGKKVGDIDKVPRYWPDTKEVRHDMLDYAVEVEYFDRHVGSHLELLEREGLLDNTLVIVTSDNGMPFPRVKGHPYHHSAHLPFMAMWKNGINDSGRTFDQFVSFTDLAPTFMELAGISQEASGMEPWVGRSLVEIFQGHRGMEPISGRDTVLMGRERNDVGRPNEWGYPVRAIRKGDYFYIHNFEPTRWPCGNPSTGFLDTDASPTMQAIMDAGESADVWKWAVGKRPLAELYDVSKDPECINNLALNPEHTERMKAMKQELFERLEQQGDLRMLGKGEWYERENIYWLEKERNYYSRFMKGEVGPFRPDSYLRSDLEDGK